MQSCRVAALGCDWVSPGPAAVERRGRQGLCMYVAERACARRAFAPRRAHMFCARPPSGEHSESRLWRIGLMMAIRLVWAVGGRLGAGTRCVRVAVLCRGCALLVAGALPRLAAWVVVRWGSSTIQR